MITKEQFSKIIQTDLDFSNYLEDLDNFGISLYESKLHDCYWTMFSMLLDTYFTEAGIDLINWWLYEDGREIYSDEDTLLTTLDTIDSLYEFMLSDKQIYFND